MQLDFLKKFGLSSYEIKTLEVLVRLGFGTAAEIAKVGNIPSSKIYAALDSLVQLGFVLHSDNTGADIYQLVSTAEVVSLVSDLESKLASDFQDQLRNFKYNLDNIRNQKRSLDIVSSKVALLGTSGWQTLLSRVAAATGSINAYFSVTDPVAFQLFASYLELCTLQIDRRVPQRVMVYNPHGVLPAGYLRSFKHIEFRLPDHELGSTTIVWDSRFGIYWAGGLGEGATVATYLESEKSVSNFIPKFDKQWYIAKTFIRYQLPT